VTALTPEQIERGARLYAGGMTFAEIAIAMGIRYQTLREALIDNGVKPRPPGTRPGSTANRISILQEDLEVRRLTERQIAVWDAMRARALLSP